MADRKDKKTTHTTGNKAKRTHLTLVADVLNEVFDDEEVMPWSADAQPVSAGSQVSDRGSNKPDPMSSSERAKYGLTTKQAAFCQAMLGGAGSASAAYRMAYGAENMKPSSVHRRAHEVLHNAKVKARLDAGYAVKEEGEQHSQATRRDFVLERLTHEAEHATSDSARVAALGLLGKAEAMFTDRVQTEEVDTRTAAEIKASIEAKLKAMAG